MTSLENNSQIANGVLSDLIGMSCLLDTTITWNSENAHGLFKAKEVWTIAHVHFVD
jgi:hypothetical protein